MRVYLVFGLKLCLIISVLSSLQCATRYEMVQDYINKGQNYYQRGQYTKSFKEFTKALNTTGNNPSEYEIAYLLAIIYHRLYLIDMTSHWSEWDIGTRARFATLSQISEQSTKPKKDLLQKSFMIISALEQNKKLTKPEKTNAWLVAEKEMIIGDLLSKDSREGKNILENKESLDLDENYIDKIRRYIIYDLALTFYLDAWIKTKEVDKGQIPDYFAAEIKSRLKDTCWSLATLSSALSYQPREKDFTDRFKGETQEYWDTLNRLEGDISTNNYEEIKQSVNQDLLVMDPAFQFNTGRINLSLAIENILAGKNAKAGDALLTALAHFTMVQKIWGSPVGGEGTELLNNALRDIYINLHQLSLPQ